MSIPRLPLLLFVTVTLVHLCHSDEVASINGPHASTDVVLSNFNSTLQTLHPQSWAVIEFYASWCPHCIHFAPEYDKIARFLLRRTIEGRIIFVGRADCQTELELCGMFNLQGYPTIALARPGDFVTLQHSNIRFFMPHPIRDAASIVQWIANVTNSPLVYASADSLPPPKPVTITVEQQPVTAPVWELQDVESATLQLFQIISQSPILHDGLDKRAALYHLLSLWALAHPSARCQQGAAGLVRKYGELWPSHVRVAPPAVLTYAMCGSDAPAIAWSACKGSLSHTRGFTCGLWLLMHSLSVRLPESVEYKPGIIYLKALKAFNDHFFQCAACRQHFGEMLARSQSQQITTRSDAILWTWRAHNEVNARLAKAVRTGDSDDGATSDPAFPKVQFPTRQACPSCRLPQLEATVDDGTVSWNEIEVVAYLTRVFSGKQLKSAGSRVELLQIIAEATSQEQASAPVPSSAVLEAQAGPGNLLSLTSLSLVPVLIVCMALVYFTCCHSSRARHGSIRGRTLAVFSHGIDASK